MGGINFDIAAILISAFNFFLFYFRRRLDIPQTACFLFLLFISLGATVADVITVATYAEVAEYPRWLIVGFNMLYYLFQNTVAPVFCAFILVLDGGYYKLRPACKRLLLAPWIVAAAIIASTPVTRFAFDFDEAMVYSRGPGLTVLYGISTLYVLVCMVSLVRARASLSGRTILGLALFLPFTIVSFVVQFFRPELLIVNFGIAVSELIILLTVNDFDVFVDGKTRLFNRAGLAALLESVDQRAVRAVALLILVDNREFLGRAAEAESSLALEREMIAGLLGRPSGRRFVAKLDFGEYVVVLVDPVAGSAEAEKAGILEGLRRPLLIGTRRLALHARLCEMRLPEDERDALAVFRAHRRLSLRGADYPRDSWFGSPRLSLSLSRRQLDISEALKRSLGRSELEVYFQPIVRSSDGVVVAAEALVRLFDEYMGPIGPDEFIPIAERDGQIHAIGDFVVERGCEFMSSMRAEGLHLSCLDVNLSPVQFAQFNLSERVLSIAGRHGLRSSDLCFEVTETAAALSPLAMKRTMEDLASRDVAVAIDDFGVGNSNILSLIRIPFATVKLDRSLIVAAGESDSGRAELEGVIAMFRRVGVTLIAEGAETLAQVEILRSMGVELVQGYYYSRPLPAEDFKAFFRERAAPCT